MLKIRADVFELELACFLDQQFAVADQGRNRASSSWHVGKPCATLTFLFQRALSHHTLGRAQAEQTLDLFQKPSELDRFGVVVVATRFETLVPIAAIACAVRPMMGMRRVSGAALIRRVASQPSRKPASSYPSR